MGLICLSRWFFPLFNFHSIKKIDNVTDKTTSFIKRNMGGGGK
jgi:hypothetical protein